jgi:hypothetical protein
MRDSVGVRLERKRPRRRPVQEEKKKNGELEALDRETRPKKTKCGAPSSSFLE